MEARIQTIGAACLFFQTSRTERPERVLAEQKSRVMSEHAMRLFETRRHAGGMRSVDVVSRHEDINAPANRALVQGRCRLWWICGVNLTVGDEDVFIKDSLFSKYTVFIMQIATCRALNCIVSATLVIFH